MPKAKMLLFHVIFLPSSVFVSTARPNNGKHSTVQQIQLVHISVGNTNINILIPWKTTTGGKTRTIYRNIFASKFICNYNQIPLFSSKSNIHAEQHVWSQCRENMRCQKFCFPPLSLTVKLQSFIWNPEAGVINKALLILFRVYFSISIQLLRSFQFIGLHRNKFEFKVKRTSSLDHISHQSMLLWFLNHN